MKKKIASIVLSAVCALTLAACGSSGTSSSASASKAASASESSASSGAASSASTASSASSASTASSAAASSGTSSYDYSVPVADPVSGNYKIGISQFAEHGSLDDCRNGFLAGLASCGIIEGTNLTVDLQNANADTGTAATIADNFVSQKDDLICGIATPSAMAAYNSTKNTDIPVIFTAVSDPVAAELADKDGKPVGNITGTSDALPVEAQLKMIREVMPDAKKIGIMYTTSETNSVSTIAVYKSLASKYNFEIVESGISTIADVPLAASDLAGKVDCISNMTDNTVVSALQTLLDAANKAKIPVFGSEVDQVKQGCLASEGIDYYKLGVQTGQMAAKVLLKQSKASEMNLETISESSLYVNTAVAKNLGITLPSTYSKEGGATVFDKIETS